MTSPMETPEPPPPERPPLPAPGKVARAAGWSKAKGEAASSWALGARETHASVDVGFRLADRDRRVAASVLAGGIAYRFFFWLLSISLLTTGALGLFDGHRLESGLEADGVGPVVTQAVGDSAGQSNGLTLSLLAVGVWLVLWTGYTSIKALVLVHATVWGVPAPPVRNPFRASLVFTGTALGFVGSMVLVRWLRTEAEVLGFVLTLALIALPVAMWLVASRWLPNRAASWVELVPGALVVAVGVQALHLFTTLLLGPKLTSATALYGALGIATTILFWLYLVARFVIGGAILNASINERSGA